MKGEKKGPGHVPPCHRPEQFNNDGDVTRSKNESLAVVTGPIEVQPPTELSERVDAELDADRIFFRQRPARAHYIRRIFPYERAQMELHGGQIPPYDPLTHAVFVAVKKVHATARVRTVFVAPRNTTDLSEQRARAIFDQVATERVRQIVSDLEAMGP
jgi:hypothetical protein